MDTENLTTHESLQLHELLNFKSLCLTKSVSMALLVSDDTLKTILQEDSELSRKHIQELKILMEKSNAAAE